MKRIAVIGTHAVGKTTTVNFLKQFLENEGKVVDTIFELSRHCPYPVNENTTAQAQKWLILKQIVEEEALTANPELDFLICDRSILDAYIYMLRRTKQEHDLFLDLIKEYLKKYDYLFLLKINESYLKDDGFRSTDIIFQKDIDRIFREKLTQLKPFLIENNIEFHEINRQEEILKVLKEKGDV